MIIYSGPALARVSAYLRAMMAGGPSPLRVGEFQLLLEAHDANRYRNYAYPDDGADPSDEGVAALIRAFRERDRAPRLEYFPELSPGLAKALSRAGFTAEGEPLPVMACTPRSLLPVQAAMGVSFRLARSEAELWAAARVQNAAYGGGEAGEADVERLRRLTRKGGAVALGELAGEPVGSGLLSAPIDGVAEIAAVGVLPRARGRGIGGGVTTFLARHALEHGVDLPFLMAAREPEARLYRSLGFSPFGEMLHISRPTPPP